jgi:hypothetical protein
MVDTRRTKRGTTATAPLPASQPAQPRVSPPRQPAQPRVRQPRQPAQPRVSPQRQPAPAVEVEAEEEAEAEEPTQRRKKKPSAKDLINEALQKSKREYASYKKLSGKWQLLKITEDKEAEDIYKNWSQKLDSFTPVVNIKDHIDNVAKWNKFFDKDFENVWANKIYMLHLPDGHPYQDDEGFTQVDIEKIVNGDYLGKNDNAKAGSIQPETENSYLSNVLNLDTYKERVLVR